MMDFTNCEINKFKYYGGRNGGKICIVYNNTDYMLKFPSVNEGISEHGYSNSCISEHITCNILKTMRFKNSRYFTWYIWLKWNFKNRCCL